MSAVNLDFEEFKKIKSIVSNVNISEETLSYNTNGLHTGDTYGTATSANSITKDGETLRDIDCNITGNAATVTDGVYTTSNVTDLSDVTNAGSGQIITAAERTAVATNTANIATNTADIATNASGITTNASGITTNASGIATNAEAINSINATKLYLNTTPSVPNEQDSQGVKGEIRMDTEYIYICVANSTWKRVALDNSDGW